MEGCDETQYQYLFPRFFSMGQSDGKGDDSMALAFLTPNARPLTSEKINLGVIFFHVPLAHADEALLRATAAQQGITLTGTLLPCSGCLEAKGRRVGIPQRLCLGATSVLGMVHLDLTGPHPRALGGWTYMLAVLWGAGRTCWRVSTANHVSISCTAHLPRPTPLRK